MTRIKHYNGSMTLLSVQGEGAAWTALLFLICVIVVHGVKLARIGYRTLFKKLPPAPPPKEPEKKSEPVYYIVEKKKKRAKPEYSEPRRIQFK